MQDTCGPGHLSLLVLSTLFVARALDCRPSSVALTYAKRGCPADLALKYHGKGKLP